MIRRLVEELERAQLEVQELRHELREEKKRNKDFQNLLEDMVFRLLGLFLTRRVQKRNSKRKI
jgi:hypothetical protein